MSPALPEMRFRRDNDIHFQPDELGCDLGEALVASSAQRYSIRRYGRDPAEFAQPLHKKPRSMGSRPRVGRPKYRCRQFAACCARAASGHAAAPPRSVMNSRRMRTQLEGPILNLPFYFATTNPFGI